MSYLATVRYRAGRFRTMRHASLRCLCFDLVRFSEKLGKLLVPNARNFSGALPASGRGAVPSTGCARGYGRCTADRRPVLGIDAVPPPAALAGCQSPVSGTRHETRRFVREALPLHVHPHSMLFVRHVHLTKCLVIQRHFPCRERRRLPDPTTS